MSIDLEIKVLEAIAHGNAVAFVGSGPSCEMGYPSWDRLAKLLLNKIVACKDSDEYKEIDNYIDLHDFPRAFSRLERLAGRKMLCQEINRALIPTDDGSDELYCVISKLPFSCYMTTNFDDELSKHLISAGRKDFKVLYNSKQDLYSFRDDMHDVIYKLHGDMNKTDSAVVTTADYSNFCFAGDRQYFMTRLQALFLMKKCIFIGYSLEDKDISNILECLKHKCSELDPVYMFLPNCSQAKIDEFSQLYGVKIITYKAQGDDHSNLVKKLEIYDKFISRSDKKGMRITEDSKHAAELYLFRVLNRDANNLDLANYILMHIPTEKAGGISIQTLALKSGVKSDECLNHAIERLLGDGYIEKNGFLFFTTPKGEEQVLSAKCAFNTEKNLAFGDFIRKISISPAQIEKCQMLLQNCLTKVFEKRGDALVNTIFNRATSITGGAMVDIYSAILPYATEFEDAKLGAEFLHAVYDFIVTPTSHQKTYLVSMAQGYFLYYMMKLGEEQSSLISRKLENTVWYVDSNLIIPLVAVGSLNHEFAVEMFKKLKRLNARLVVVPSVLEEVKHHLKWAMENDLDDGSKPTISVAMLANQQNLFVDGYIRMKASGKVPSAEKYFNMINSLLDSNAKRLLDSYGLKLEHPRKVYPWNEDEYQNIKNILTERRKKSSSYRRNFQIETDAELLYAMKCRKNSNIIADKQEEVSFLSQSTLFNDESDIFRTWSGEAMFRFVQVIDPVMSSEETLHECLQNELYNAGIRFIDEEKYGMFFKEDIDMAEMTFEKQKQEFAAFLDEPNLESFADRFHNLPELQRPIFIRQMEEKRRMFNEEQVAELKKKIEKAEKLVRGKNEEVSTKDKVIEDLRKELDKKSEALKIANNRISNLESGKAIKKFMKKQKQGKKIKRK